MNEPEIEPLRSGKAPRAKGGHTVAITAIVMVGIVLLVCILAITGVAVAFILNAPW